MLQLSGCLLGAPRHCRANAAVSVPPCRRSTQQRSGAAAAAKTEVSASAAPATTAADADAAEMQHIAALLSTLTAPGMDVVRLDLHVGDLKLKVVRRQTPVAPPPAPVAAPAAPLQQQQQQRPARRAPAYAR
jgi:hypothetical protein